MHAVEVFVRLRRLYRPEASDGQIQKRRLHLHEEQGLRNVCWRLVLLRYANVMLDGYVYR